ncbi:MAG: type II secretion system F family protein [Patescibacteria group bacterium]
MKLFKRISHKERAFVARQMAVMISAGLPLTQAVRSLSEQTDNPTMAKVLQQVVDDLENGYSFSRALAKQPTVFSQVFISVAAAGEQTGKLDHTLTMLADELERDQGFRSRVIGSLLYPAFIIVAMIVVGLIMVTRIVPALESVFKEAKVDLPWTTRTVVAVTNSIISYWYLYIIGLGMAIFLFIRYTRTEDGRRAFNALLLRVPAFGTMIANLELARFTRIFGMMTDSGVPIIAAIQAVAGALDNLIFQESLAVVSGNVERGATLSQSLRKFPVFPSVVTQMVAVGEQTGQLDTVLIKLADYYENETNQSIRNITALTEPVVFVIVGLAVAFLVFSIIVPIYNLASVIN